MLRIVGIVALVAVMATAAFASAAALPPLRPNNIQAGSSDIGTCAGTADIPVYWETAISGLNFVVTGVDLSLPAACAGQRVVVTTHSSTPGSFVHTGTFEGTALPNGWVEAELTAGAPLAEGVVQMSVLVKSR